MDDRERERADLDFKAALPPRDKNADMARDLAAMANSGGGTIIYGVAERGGRADKLHPFDLTGAAERVSAVARERIDEALALADVVDVPLEPDGTGVLIVRVEQDERVPYFVDGQALGRSGPKNVALSRAEVGRLYASGGRRFLEEFGIRTVRPAAVRARIETDRYQKFDSKGRPRSTTSHYLVVRNEGEQDAHDVSFRFAGNEETDRNERLPHVVGVEEGPITHLLAHQEVKYPVAVFLGAQRKLEVQLTWRDTEGMEHYVDQTITV
ncbi:MAG TPA: ATP-binding protein [Acidimicrobiales bacterium]|nr:ATP-binding protein [Acidimicrobiales bacterium]